VSPPAEAPTASGRRTADRSVTPAARRHVVASVVGGGASFAVFLWMLWAAPGGFLDKTPFGLGGFYDAQTRAWFRGHWYADAGSFFIERITVGGHSYMYFGPWPSLLRAPLMAITSSYDGRLTRLSLLLAVAVLLVGVGRLVWQVRTLRGTGVPSRREQVAVAVFLLAVGCGSSVIVLSASVWVYDEAILWGAAWAIWSLSFAIAYLVDGSTRSLVLASASATLAISSRASSGVVGVVVLGAIFGVQLFGSVRHDGLRAFGHRVARIAGVDDELAERRPWPALLAVAVPIVAYAAVNWAKFGAPLAVPFQHQDIVNRIDPLRRAVLRANGNDLLSLNEIPTNVLNYFRPDGISLNGLFPFVDFSRRVTVIGSPARDVEWLYASLSLTATFLLVLAVVGATVVAVPRVARRTGLARARVLRVPALATVASLGPTLMFPAVFQRYTVDFTPALVLLGATGMYAAGALVRSRAVRAVVAVAAGIVLAWNVAANLALTLNLQRGYQDVVTPVERAAWIKDRIEWNDRLGIDPSVTIVRWRAGTPKPEAGPVGSFLVVDDCKALMLSDGQDWLTVATTDPKPLCRALDR